MKTLWVSPGQVRKVLLKQIEEVKRVHGMQRAVERETFYAILRAFGKLWLLTPRQAENWRGKLDRAIRKEPITAVDDNGVARPAVVVSSLIRRDNP